MLLLHVYILLVLLLHNIVYNVLSDNTNCCYKIVVVETSHFLKIKMAGLYKYIW